YIWSPILLGHVSDKIGRKAAIIYAMIGFISTNCLILLFATRPIHLMFAFMSAGFFFGFYFPVLGAFSSEISEGRGKAEHSRVLSNFMIAWSIGLTSGPLIGGLLNAYINHLIGFTITVAIGIGIIAVATLFIPDKKCIQEIKDYLASNPAASELGDTNGIYGQSGKERENSKNFMNFIKIAIVLMSVVFSFNNQIIFSIFPAYGINFMSLTFVFQGLNRTFVVGLIIFTMGIGRTISFWHTRKLNRKNRMMMIVLAPLMMALMMLLVFLTKNAVIWILALSVYGIMSGYAFAIGLILLLELSKTGKGLNAGFYEAAVGVGVFTATLVSSFIGQLNLGYPFILGFITTISIDVILFIFKGKVNT
ncbi:MAG: MFS transporter, partial [Promethearchaeota archaeon]